MRVGRNWLPGDKISANGRNYAAEQRRRNVLAGRRGYSSRGSQRHKIETGKIEALQISRVRSPKSLAGQARYIQELTGGEDSKRDRKVIDRFLMSMPSKADQCEAWSAIFARSVTAEYLPEDRKEGWSEKRYMDSYYAAFVGGDQKYKDVRYSGGSPALKKWFTVTNDFLRINLYENRYGRRKN